MQRICPCLLHKMKTQELMAAKVLPERPSDTSKTNFLTVFPIKQAPTNIYSILGRKRTNRLYWCDHSGENIFAGYVLEATHALTGLWLTGLAVVFRTRHRATDF